jgi:DNA polymerase-3 subunit delta'
LNLNCANLLLKSLEEPRPHTVFMLQVPQRERLLPTLVSRSWVLTLSWPREEGPDESVAEWISALAEFLETGKGFFSRTSQKGAVNRDLALSVVVGCQRDLADAMSGGSDTPLGRVLTEYGASDLRLFDLALAGAVDALNTPTPVNPALVLDWLATRMETAR